MSSESKSIPVEAMAKIVDVLSPLDVADRAKVIRAALALLGEGHAIDVRAPNANGGIDHSSDLDSISPRARTWMRQTGLTKDHLDQVFHHGDEGFDVIASHMPGSNKKEQTYNAYLLTGVASLLASGNPFFQDKLARSLCESSGCYDSTNHATHISKKGNEFTGSKDKGWTLTAPGLKRAAEIIKQLCQSVS